MQIVDCVVMNTDQVLSDVGRFNYAHFSFLKR